MKKYHLAILAIVIFSFSALIICTTVKENNRSVAVFSQNYRVDINTATEKELIYLPGITDETAANIIEYRKNCKFKFEI